MSEKIDDINNRKNNYKVYITGLKGFACVMVMLGHFLGLYKYEETFPVKFEFLDLILDSKLDFILSESFWLYLFFVVSGYLLSFNKIKRIKDILLNSFMRFLRLGLPILFSCFMIFLIYNIIGFHNKETTDLFFSEFYQGAFSRGSYPFIEVLLSPFKVLFLKQTTFNNPYWVLREMFIASIVIYIISYLKNKFPKYNKLIVAVSLALVFVGFKLSSIVSACVIGMLLGWYEDRIEKIVTTSGFAISAVLITFLCYFLPRTQISLLFFSSLILYVPKIKILNSIFSSKVAEFIGKISFGIYSFHWPLYSSVGALFIIYLSVYFNLKIVLILAVVLTVLTTIILSYLYNITFERFAGFITKKIKGILFKTK